MVLKEKKKISWVQSPALQKERKIKIKGWQDGPEGKRTCRPADNLNSVPEPKGGDHQLPKVFLGLPEVCHSV